MTEIITDEIDLSEFDEAVRPFLFNAAVAVKEAETDIIDRILEIGKLLQMAFEKCDAAQWLRYCELIKVGETRARQYRQSYERFKDRRDEISGLSASVVLELSAPSVPESAIETVVATQRETGTVTKSAAKEIVADAKAHPGAPIDHDVDRTKQEPQLDTGFDEKTALSLLHKIRSAVSKAHEYEQLDQAIISMLDSLVGEIQVGEEELVGLDDVTIKGLLRTIGA